MKVTGLLLNVGIMGVLGCGLTGCGHDDTDVTALPKYNFASLAGTSWKTKGRQQLRTSEEERTCLPLRVLTRPILNTRNHRIVALSRCYQRGLVFESNG